MELLVTKETLRWNGTLSRFELNQEYIEFRFKMGYHAIYMPFIVPCLRSDLEYNYWPLQILKKM